MRNNNLEDQKLLKKAKIKINIQLVLIGLLVIAVWPSASYGLLRMMPLTKPENFDILYLCCAIVQTAFWISDFFLLSGAVKGARKVFWAGIAAECAWIAWLVWSAVSNPACIWFYLLWILLLGVRDIILAVFGNWLDHGWWARIYFDHVLEVSRSASARPMNPSIKNQKVPASSNAAAGQKKTQAAGSAARSGVTHGRAAAPERTGTASAASAALQSSSRSVSPAGSQNTAAARQTVRPNQPGSAVISNPQAANTRPAMHDQPDFQTVSMPSASGFKKKVASERAEYRRCAIRIFCFLIGEMILFPMTVHIFQNAFVSTDNSTMFAGFVMFSLCMLSTVIWLIPIYFMYLFQPGTKMALRIAAVVQILLIAGACWWLYSIAHTEGGPVYPMAVYIKFIALEAVRYAGLVYVLYPAFGLSPITREEADDYEDELQ